MGNNSTKKPLYTVRVESKQPSAPAPTQPNISGSGIQKQSAMPQPGQSKPKVLVENMTMEQLLASYHKTDEDEEPMLPGFNYLKKMKNTIKAERVKSVLKR